jgi:hypothetical protein
MKLLCFLLLFPIFGFAQGDTLVKIFPLADGQIRYEKIVDADTVNKGELMKRAKLWALNSLTSQKDALQTEDKDAGLLAYTSFFAIPYRSQVGAQVVQVDWRYWNTLKMFFKDGKVKLVMENFQHETSGYPQKYDLISAAHGMDTMKENKLKKRMVEETAAAILDLLTSMHGNFCRT